MIMSGIVRNRKQKPIAVYCMPDHAHLLVGLNGIVSISDLVRDVKAGSSNLINEKRMFPFKFQWQSGYGAFSHSNRDLQKLVGYVLGQEKHHAKLGIEQEFISLSEEHHIPYDLRWVFG